MNNKCPICFTEYVEQQSQCKICKWDLSLSVDNNLSPSQILEITTHWGRKIWKFMLNYKMERKQIKQDLVTLNTLILQLQERVSILEENQLQPKNSLNSKLDDTSTTEIVHQKSETNPVNISKINQSDEISSQEKYIIDLYYDNPERLLQYVYKVKATKKTLEDIYLNQANEIIFEISNQSDYWIIELDNGESCLLPDLDLKINTNLKTIKAIFELRDSEDNQNKTFRVIKSAKVSVVNKKEWCLLFKGILQF